VLARLDECIVAIENAYSEYRFNEVVQRLYDFFWSDYCDWFIEAAKTDIFAEDAARKTAVLAVMDYVLSAVLRLLHPLMPHITEELWAVLGLGSSDDESIQFAAPPETIALEKTVVAEARRVVGAIYSTVRAGRNLRAESRVPSNMKVPFILRASHSWVADELATIARLLNAAQLMLEPEYAAPAGVPVAVTDAGELYLLAENPADAGAELERLDKEIAKAERELEATHRKLSNSSFMDKAPREVVAEHRQRKLDFAEKLAQLRAARAALQ